MDSRESNIKDFMTIGYRPVYLAVSIDGLDISGVTVTSLVSTSVTDGSEEIALVLRESSSFVKKINKRNKFSIYLLDIKQRDLAIECSQRDKSDEVIKEFFTEGVDSQGIYLNDYVGHMSLKMNDFVVRGDNCVIFASVVSVSVSSDSSRSTPLMYGFGRFQDEEENQ